MENNSWIICQRCGVKANSGKSNAKWCSDCKIDVVNEQHRKTQIIIDYEAIRKEVKNYA
jgi:ribosomal protein L37E